LIKYVPYVGIQDAMKIGLDTTTYGDTTHLDTISDPYLDRDFLARLLNIKPRQATRWVHRFGLSPGFHQLPSQPLTAALLTDRVGTLPQILQTDSQLTLL
jgi:hypothetical protein